MNARLRAIDAKLSGLMDKYGVWLLRISLGLIFVWFGLLKTLGVSEANEMVAETVT